MSEAFTLDMNTAHSRSLIYGRLAQAFVYPEKGVESLLAAVDYTVAFDPACSDLASSLREYTYATDIHSTSLNEELIRFYHFFGLNRSPSALMPDHIAIELEFMQFLSVLEYRAAERGEDVTSIKKAQRDFLHRHLSILAHGLASEFKADVPDALALIEMTTEVIDVALMRLHEEVGLGGDVAA